MANSARSLPGSNRPRKVEEQPELQVLDNLKNLYEKYQNILITSVSVVLVVVIGYFGYQKMYKEPNETKAANAISYPQMAFQADSLNMAMSGFVDASNKKRQGFTDIAKKFSGTPAGNLANFYTGITYLKMGDMDKAIKALQSFDGAGTLLAYQSFGLLGEAYMEKGNKAKAIEYFKKATANKEDQLLTPIYLYQLGLAYADNKDTKNAIDAFKSIRDEYPRSMQAREIDKDLARLGVIE